LEVEHSCKVLLLILDILNNSNSHDDFTANTANRENWGIKKPLGFRVRVTLYKTGVQASAIS
jgi:hypothetical protein